MANGVFLSTVRMPLPGTREKRVRRELITHRSGPALIFIWVQTFNWLLLRLGGMFKFYTHLVLPLFLDIIGLFEGAADPRDIPKTSPARKPKTDHLPELSHRAPVQAYGYTVLYEHCVC